MTNMNADVQDIFIERINPSDPNVYEYDGKWVEMDTRVEQISFRTKELETFFIKKQVRNTIHGPVMNDVAPEVPEVISLSWTGLEPTQDLESLYDVNLAGNWLEFTRALSKFGVAPQNFVYADVDGNIGYYGAGIIPVRQSGSGIMPRKGWIRESTWKGRIPFYEMPHVFNPPSGYIITANNRVAGDEYGHFLSAEWAPSFRYQRIAELIESENSHDEKSVARIQSDTKSLLARLLCEEVMPALADLSDPQLRDAVERLQTWDFDTTTDSVAATIYHEFLIRFARNTFIDDMGEELAGKYLDNYYLWIERFVAFVQQGSRWFDNVRTEKVEARDDIAAESFKEAIASLRERLGENMSRWRWGLVHTVEFRHPLDDNRLVRRIFNYGPFPFPGDGESVNRGAFGFTAPYSMTMAASLRHIMNFSRLRETLAIHTTGQSANPLSSHYHDFGDRWLIGEYAIMMMDRHDFISGAEGRLILAPAGQPLVESVRRR
jgi:penicillin amidase